MSGLSPAHHALLNALPGDPGIYNRLRALYAGDSVAQQQIDVYDPNTSYHGHFRRLRDALKRCDAQAEATEMDWFRRNYPDV